MPLDASLNNEVHTCVDMHDVHPQPKIRRPWLRNVSRHTAAKKTSAYLQLLDPDLGLEAGMLLGHRVSQGIEKFIPALKAESDPRPPWCHCSKPGDSQRTPRCRCPRAKLSKVVSRKREPRQATSGLTLMPLRHDRSSTQLL